MRRAAPLLVTLALAVLLGSYLLYMQRVISNLRAEASRSGRMYARIFDALGDPREETATAALLDLSQYIRQSGVPMIVTDAAGRPTAAANLPFDAPLDSRRVAEYVRELDLRNPPVVELGVGTVHFGDSPLVAGLRVVPLIQVGTLLLLLLAAVLILRTRGLAERESVWAGMARESAHQLGTPLSSLNGWVELLAESGVEMTATALTHMRGDLDRLENVAHRFERIGRPPRREAVELDALVSGVARYFQARVPTLANRVTIECVCHSDAQVIQGDPVLLEWAFEALIKNAVDALAGRGGRIDITTATLPEGGVRVRIADDGPGVPRELRRRIFAPGFSSKQSGWGIGLSLARRIIQDNHGGKLLLVPSDRGATFDAIFH